MPRKQRFSAATLPPLPVVTSLADVIDNFATIATWATAVESPIGYFAVVYKRATLAIQKATATPGEFENPSRMVDFCLNFSQRYFDALGAYVTPVRGKPPTGVWLKHFQGTTLQRPIIMQHLLTAVNAHINLDLGIAACQVGGDDMPDLHNDFTMVNAVLGSQVAGVLDALSPVSPGMAEARRLFNIAVLGEVDEVEATAKLLAAFRDGAWTYGTVLSQHPADFDGLVEAQDENTTKLGACYLNPPSVAIRVIIGEIKRVESTNVPDVIAALDVDITKTAPLNRRFLE